MSNIKTMKFSGISMDVDTSVRDNGRQYRGEMKPGKPRAKAGKAGEINGAPYEPDGSFSRKWWRQAGAVKDGSGYVRVMKRKKLPIVALILLLAAVILLLLWFAARRQAEENPLHYVGGRTESSEAGQEASGTVEEYTSFESVPEEIVWESGKTEQRLTLKNLEGNDVDLVPKVYLDLNSDGNYSDDECVFNENGTDRIAPGNELDTVELNQAIPDGKYNARVVYEAYLQGTDSQANGMTFDFHVTVQ